MEDFYIALKASSWIVKMRWNYFLLSITFWTLMSCFAISDCKPKNRNFLIPILLILLVLKCAAFIYFSYKITAGEPKVKGPTIIPAGVYNDIILPVAFVAIPLKVFYSGSRSVAGLFILILFIPIASFFKIAASLDPRNMATQVAIGTSIGMCCVMISVNGVRMAFVPGGLTIVVALCFFFLNHYLYKKLELVADE